MPPRRLFAPLSPRGQTRLLFFLSCTRRQTRGGLTRWSLTYSLGLVTHQNASLLHLGRLVRRETSVTSFSCGRSEAHSCPIRPAGGVSEHPACATKPSTSVKPGAGAQLAAASGRGGKCGSSSGPLVSLPNQRASLSVAGMRGGACGGACRGLRADRQLGCCFCLVTRLCVCVSCVHSAAGPWRGRGGGWSRALRGGGCLGLAEGEEGVSLSLVSLPSPGSWAPRQSVPGPGPVFPSPGMRRAPGLVCGGLQVTYCGAVLASLPSSRRLLGRW